MTDGPLHGAAPGEAGPAAMHSPESELDDIFEIF